MRSSDLATMYLQLPTTHPFSANIDYVFGSIERFSVYPNIRQLDLMMLWQVLLSIQGFILVQITEEVGGSRVEFQLQLVLVKTTHFCLESLYGQ